MSQRVGYSLTTVTQLLNKIKTLDIKNTGWQKIKSSSKNPVFLDNLRTPGNYSISFWRQGPQSITSKVPINVVVSHKKNEIYQTVFYLATVFERSYVEEGEAWTGWAQLQSLSDSEFGSNEPANPCSNMIWFDTSTGVPVLRVFNAQFRRWELAMPQNMLKVSIYDPQGRKTDLFAYVTAQIETNRLLEAHTAFENHIADNDIHITQAERDEWDAAQYSTDMEALVGESKDAVHQTVADLVDAAHTMTGSIQTDASATYDEFKAHNDTISIHPNYAHQSDWISKSDQAHEHYLDGRVSINADKISGVIDSARFDLGAMERGVSVETEADRLALTINEIQDGDSVYVKATKTAYFVVDETKLGSEAAFKPFTKHPDDYIWSNIKPESLPTTVKGFGIVDAYDDSELQEVVGSVVTNSHNLIDPVNKASQAVDGLSYSSTQTVLDSMAAMQTIADDHQNKLDRLNGLIGCAFSY